MTSTAAAVAAKTVAPGMAVRWSSWAGPCLSGTVIRLNRLTVTVNFYGMRRRVPTASVHAVPCNRCTDHPNTSYPRGYED
jgi:hypothetical protein